MKTIKYLAAAVLVLMTASCSKSRVAQMEMAENVISTCSPKVLECVAGKIPATVSVTYPEGYFAPDAMMIVTPVLVYDGGEQVGQSYIYQGEKVRDNNKVVAYKAGGTVTEKMVFTYAPGMEKSHLELRSAVIYNSKRIDIPAVKVADGCNTTYMLVSKSGVYAYKPDGYEEVEHRTSESQIRYDVNSSDIRSTSANRSAMQDIKATLDEAKENSRIKVRGTEIIAYASPEGGEDLNAKLSDKRAESAKKAWSQATKGSEAATTEIKSIGQDWDGFQEAVAKSKIEDKDLILRVLSMYSDPAVRESEIKNMSNVYTELKGEVLPELRRARFIANVEYKNFTKEELLQLINDNSDVLDEEALLRVATLVPAEQKPAVYQKAIDKFKSARAAFNLAVAYMELGQDDKAASQLAKCTVDADVLNAQGVIALHKGDLKAAAQKFAASNSAAAKANQGVVDILSGNYASAVENLKDAPGCCHNAVLAYILNGQLDKAAAAAKCEDAPVQYLKAIIAARQGKAGEAKAYLDKATKAEKFAARVAKDIEFVNVK